jgi:two-component system phosphate regulon sensor histidine kinase PhoR
MRFSKINIILLASTLAVLSLIYIQVRWMQKSHDLIENQFNQRVKMALCSAVESLDDDESIPQPSFQFPNTLVTPKVEMTPQCATVDDFESANIQKLESALAKSLAFYNVDLPYEIKITEGKIECSMFSCSLTPLKNGKQQIRVIFPDKEQYIFDEMSWMFMMSVLILLFVVLVLWAANHTLLRQKRISEINIDFFNNMAHEFRTPLTSIQLAMKLMTKKQPEIADSKYLGVIRRESKQLLQQVERVLHLAKMEGNEYELQKAPVALDALLDTTIDEMEMLIKAKNATVQVSKSADMNWEVLGDAFHLGNAFRNLIDNALKYSSDQPLIDIELKKHPKGIQVIFQDNGIGISKSEQSLVFNKYHRAKMDNANSQKGFGIGLAYVKMIVERHKGIVNIVSELQRGSRFDVIIPNSMSE